MSITINVTPITGGSFTAAGVESGNITLTVGGGIGPPGAGNVALAAGDGITISSTNNVATITSTVQGVPASNLADLADVDATAPTSGQVLEWNGTAWAPGLDSTLTLASTGGSDLGASTAGTSSEAARADHVHNLPALADLVGVSLGTPVAGQVLAYDGTAWAPASDNALTLSTSAGADLGAAGAGSAGVAARADHVHNLPTFAEITNGTATVTGNLTLDASTGSVTLNGGTAGSASLTLNCEQNTHGVTIASPAHSAAASYTLTLPATAGSANQVLTTDGTGSLSWSTGGSGGGISWSSVPTDSNANGTAGQVAYDSQGFFYLHDGTSWRRVQLATFGVVPTTRLLAENGDSLLSEGGDYIAHDGNPAQITITSQPQNATASGGTASFSVTATVDDSSTLAYQWQEFTGAIWADVTGGTSSTLSLGGLTSGDDGDQYRVQVSSPTAATVTSATATLTVSTVSNWTQYGSDIDGGAAGEETSPVALSNNGSVMAVGDPGNASLRIFTDDGAAWVEATLPGFTQLAGHGSHVAMDSGGTRVLTASEFSAANSTALVLFHEFTAGNWTVTGFSQSSGGPVALSGDGGAAAVGSPGIDSTSVYQIATTGNGTNSLSLIGSAIAPDPYWYNSGAWISVDARHGAAVALDNDGDVLAVAYEWPDWQTAGQILGPSPTYTVYEHDLTTVYEAQSAAVQVYDWTGTSWVEKGPELVGTSHLDLFGASLALSSDGTRLAVGAPYGDAGGTDRGYVRVLSWTGSAWSQLGSDIAGVNNYDYAGWSVDISSDGSRVVVGLRGADTNGSNSGTTRIYDWSGTAWVQVGGDIEGSAANDYSGSFVTISGDGTRVGIGAPGNDDGGAEAGQVRVFEAT